ncbi:MBL fold metallo-hydrolase [Paracoccus aerodenitrificans]|uniref:MBL fold metallo-hydrolase n=1 Tax=Paracoccus aerodenitrificans TaxID=3017781 RepID=UPI0022F0EB9F|nr:MBL fold metallo-hydrolase [Paracoccus aerodenitrificans]WBU65129.1 MBL fold metallo-hydrolase [Paracoccus aerodenitrificans]
MLQTILAPNPSPLTGPGTNTFLLGEKNIAVIDPGPDIASHREAILAAAGGHISHILVTHAHLDHSEGAAALAAATGAPVCAFSNADAGRSAHMQKLAAATGGGEGRDLVFAPDELLRDGDSVSTPDWSLTAIHTPGHMGNHLAFLWEDQLFCGDVILGWSSTLISPPDGDLLDYFRSLDRIEALRPARLLPAHGAPVETPDARIHELREHRRNRTAQIMTALADGPSDAASLAERLYDISPRMLPAAARNVLAHLIALTELGAVIPDTDIAADAQFRLR